MLTFTIPAVVQSAARIAKPRMVGARKVGTAYQRPWTAARK